jgi:uncharacterized protein (TIGR03435 family)
MYRIFLKDRAVNRRISLRIRNLSHAAGLVLGLLYGFAGAAQPGEQVGSATLTFDVASVKLVELHVVAGSQQSNSTYHIGARSDRTHGLFGCDYCSLELMLCYAYGVKTNEIVGPSWLLEDTFQVDARMPPGTSQEELHQMLQALLAQRFGLKLHRERRLLPAYALVIAGPKHKLETAEKEVDRYVSTPGEMDYAGINMAGFAHQLSSRIGGTVVDKTGLEGFYRIKLKWENWPADKGPDSEIYAALKDQLGLALRPEKLDAEVLVVDKANRVPLPN